MPLVREQLPDQFGRYGIIRKIAEGGMGAVYLARDSVLDRRVAIKVPHFSDDVQPMVLERFLNEARLAAKVNHPHLCSIFDAGEIDGIHYLTMPFIEGPTLASLVSPLTPWAPAKALRLTYRLAVALHALHSQGIVHRDLKPSNVMLQDGGDPVVMDFGIARNYDSQTHHLTGENALGTPYYMAPEQLLGKHQEVGPRSDVYSLGVIFYQLLTGRVPFEGEMEAVYAQILNGEPKPPSTRLPTLSADVDALCLKAIAKNKDDRYSTMMELAQTIERHLAGASDQTIPFAAGMTNDAAMLPTVEHVGAYDPPPIAADAPIEQGEAVPARTRLSFWLNVLLPLLPWIVTVGFVAVWTVRNH